jgi:(p)ppGpp synthase/HD superfamily hydrolase
LILSSYCVFIHLEAVFSQSPNQGAIMSAATSRPPGYELFFAPLEVSLEPNDTERIQFAYFCSKYGHAKHPQRDDGSRYFDHPKAAAWIYVDELGGRDPRAIIDILLHDVREGTYLLSSYRISINFGEDVALDVRAGTKLPKGKETVEEYLERVIARGPWAILMKLCDRLHNVRTLGGCSEGRRDVQIHETLFFHIPLLIPALHAHDGPWTGYADILNRKLEEAIRQYRPAG